MAHAHFTASDFTLTGNYENFEINRTSERCSMDKRPIHFSVTGNSPLVKYSSGGIITGVGHTFSAMEEVGINLMCGEGFRPKRAVFRDGTVIEFPKKSL